MPLDVITHTQSDRRALQKQLPAKKGARKGGSFPLKLVNNMTLTDFSKRLKEFYEQGCDRNIHNLSSMLSVVRKYFLSCYDDIDEKEFAGFRGFGITGADKKAALKKELIKQIGTLNRNIKGCSNPKVDFKAFGRLYNYFFDEKGRVRDAGMLADINARTDFYRMRSAESYHVYKREEIFQIAGENRRYTSKLRFSDDGHPCLYLGASLYIAWEEVRRPSFDTVNFARFSNNRKLSVLDLTISPHCHCLADFLKSYLCLLTSAKVEDGDKYKYRYEVSGLLMKLLQNSIARKGNVDGIKYISSRRFDGDDIEIAGSSIMEAYVFPPKETSDKGVDAWLKNVFEVSAVRTTFLYNIHQVNIVNPKIAITSDYMDTLFWQLEQQLKREKLEKVK